MRSKFVIFIWFWHVLSTKSCSSRSRPRVETCQNVTLKSSEYTLKNGILITNYSNDTFINYCPQNGSVNLCYPFSAEFITCFAEQYTWLLLPTEYSWKNNTSVLRDLVHKVDYPPGYYEFRPEDHVRVCIPLDDRPPFEKLVLADNYVSIVGSIVSAISIIISFIIYLIAKSPITNLKSILNHMASLFIAYVFIAAHCLISKTYNEFVCYLTAFGKQFGMIAAMCWMNVVAFELWWRFRPKKLLQSSVPSRDRRLIILQYCYGWGIPLLILAITGIFEIYKYPVYPNILESCSIYSVLAQLVLYYGPISLSLTLNIVLFVMTMISLCRVRKYIAFSTGKSQRQILSMSAKLIVVMGIPWVFDVITWLSNTRPEYWILPETIMAFQGFVLGIVYLSRKTIREEIKKKSVIFITDNCCFCIAKRVALSPYNGNVQMTTRNSTTQSSVSVV